MTLLKDRHDTLDEIPENYRELYTEKNGKYEFTGVQGVKTQADVDRVSASLTKERDAHKATKAALDVWNGLNLKPEEVTQKLDRFEELEAASGGKLDDAKIEEIATKRSDGIVKSKLGPLERELAKAKKDREEFEKEVLGFREKDRKRKITDTIQKVLVSEKVLSSAFDDAFILAESVMDVSEDGAVLTREARGFQAGLDPVSWVQELKEKRPHWWPDSVGGGALGTRPGGGGGGKNPWSSRDWNVTEQHAYAREKGIEQAKKAAAQAGTSLGGPRPKPKD